ncbi:MAG: TIGR01777 family oxidoreductase [Burkholderiales bacterium]|nr:TIGR01777 family oxidoreductase [Burkholderiales bacterium]
MSLNVLVTGATGFIGRALVADLLRGGASVIALSRDARAARALLGPRVRVVGSLQEVADDEAIDACVHLAGARVLGPPWTAGRRRLLLESRARIAGDLMALLRRLRQRPRVLVGASAIGWYGRSPDAANPPCDESHSPQPGQFQSDLCVAIEQALRPAQALGVRVVALRFGIVLGADGGAYPPQARAARFGLASVLGSGRQPVPWVHIQDAVGLARFAIDHEALAGPVNAVAPQAPTQAEFARALAASFGRGVWLRMPAAPLRLALGEMADLLLEGRPVVPAAAREQGYAFRFPGLEAALADLARRH